MQLFYISQRKTMEETLEQNSQQLTCAYTELDTIVNECYILTLRNKPCKDAKLIMGNMNWAGPGAPPHNNPELCWKRFHATKNHCLYSFGEAAFGQANVITKFENR